MSAAARKPLLFEVVLAATGDRAYAEDDVGALAAAGRLVDDAVEFGRWRGMGARARIRKTIYIAQAGTYSGVLTAFAREGVRSL